MGKFRFILGAATGAAAALLFAPRTGKETRQLLSDKIEDVADRAPQPIRDAAEPFVDKAEDVYSKVSSKTADVAPQTDDIKAKIAAARDALAEQITRNHACATPVEADVEDLSDDVTEIVEDAAAAVADAGQEPADEAVQEVEEPAQEEDPQPAAQQSNNNGWYV